MPATTEEFFDDLMAALRYSKTDINDLKKMIESFDVTSIHKDGRNIVMIGCGYASSPEALKLIFDRINEVGGENLLKKQFAAVTETGQNCIMIACSRSKSPEVLKFALEKIVDVGGKSLLYDVMSAADNDGLTPLMLRCCNCRSLEGFELICQYVVEAGGNALLKHQLSAKSKVGKTALDFLTGNSAFYQIDFREHLYKLFSALLTAFDLWNEHNERLISIYAPTADIKSSSWVPDPDTVVLVKRILKSGVDGLEKKAEEGAAAVRKKKAEEEAAAAAQKKKKVEEQEAAAAAAAAQKKKVEEEEKAKASTLKPQPSLQQQDSQSFSFDSPPPSRCFKRGVPDKNLEDSVNSLFSIKHPPSNRPDLQNWIPDKNDAGNLLRYLEAALPGLKDRPAIKKLIAENGLTDDDIKVLHSYKIQNPYPVYLWLNGWLGGDRRDDFVKENVAPFFVLLYRAMEKLPKFKTVANRAVKVNGIPSLKNAYDNYETVCAPGRILSFWGFSSFSTESDVVNREEFVGKPHEEAIVYSCGELEGVDMEPFAPKGLKDESEILPLCPCVLEVTTTFKIGQKVAIAVKQGDHSHFSYVAPKE